MKKSILFILCFLFISISFNFSQTASYTKVTYLSTVTGGTGEYIQNLHSINTSLGYGLTFFTGGTTSPKMSILGSTGNVGIGTTSPALRLDVRGDGSKIGLANSAAWDHLYMFHDGATAFFRAGGAESGLAFQVNGGGSTASYDGQTYTEAMRLLGNGNVGIGTTSPGYKLSVAGNGHSFNVNPHPSGIDLYSTGNFAPHYQTDFTVYKGVPGSGSGKFTINTDGNVGIGTTTPGTKLEVAGQVKITGGAPGVGKVLTSDANGLASWVANTSSQWSTNGTNVYYNGGKIGIGTTTPEIKLDVRGDGSKIGLALNNTTDHLYLFHDITTAYLRAGGANNGLAFQVNGGGLSSYDGGSYPEVMRLLSNGNVGIGTTAPVAKLDLIGQIKISDGSQSAGRVLTSDADGLATWADPTNQWITDGSNIYYASGNVGIGTGAPTESLEVAGAVRSTGLKLNDASVIRFDDNGEISSADDNHRILFRRPENIFEIREFGDIIFSSGSGDGTSTNTMTIGSTGSVGIGVTVDKFEPNCRLSINGATYIGDFGAGYNAGFIRDSLLDDYYLWVEKGIVSEDYVVAQVTEWDDYVFNKDYELPSLKSIETFIQNNKHLPNIPSEAEVKKDGYSVHKLNRGLLKTAEEQTLHIIQQEKKIIALEAQVKELQQLAVEVEKLKQLLLENKK